jgi:hypothetical protein
MNSSIYSADRATHRRIIVVALVISTAIVGLAVSARIGAVEAMQASARPSQIEKADAVSRGVAAARTELRRI